VASRKDKIARLSDGKNRKRLDWWNFAQEDAHGAMFDAARRMRKANQRRRREAIYHACLYDDAELAQLAAGYVSVNWDRPSTLTTNIVKRSIDTYVAMTSRNKPAPLAQTDGANFMQQRRAKRLTKTMRGSLEQAGYYRMLTTRIRDAAIYGSAFALNYRIGAKLFHDRVYTWEVDVDFRDALYGKPSVLCITRYVDCAKLQAQFPGHDDIIERADGRDPDDVLPLGYDQESDQRVVRMMWYLPTSPTSNDGRFAVAVSTGVVHWARFTWETFPLSKLDFSPATVGWYGEGMARQLAGIQYEANEIGLKLSEANYLTPAFFVHVPNGVHLETDKLDNLPGAVIRSDGPPPQFITPQAAHPDLFNYYQAVRSYGTEESGVNQLAMSGQKPAGLNSGKAMRIYKDNQAERFLPQGELVEQDCIDTAWCHYRLLEEAYAEDPSLVVKVQGRDSVEDIPWGKVRMDLDQFTLSVKPVNLLSNSPSARVEEAAELVNGPFGFTPEEGLELLDYPDLEGARNRRTAKRRYIMACLDRILDAEDPYEPGVYIRPEPPMDLDLAFTMAHELYQDLRTKTGVSEQVLMRVLDFALDADNERQKAAPPPDAAPPMPAGPAPMPEEPINVA
jgi:hypothetical protein